MIIIFKWDDDDVDDDDGSAVEMAPLESSRRLLSFYKVEDGHLLWTSGCNHKRVFFQQHTFRNE